jgi:ATP-dependent Lon protease
MNPVILLDEFDKVSGKEALRKDYMAIMLEILDPQQNKTFRDWYLDYPVDLSKVLFIATANRFTTLSRELLDRMEIIEFPDYTMEVKTKIAIDYLFPQVLYYAGLRENELQITEEGWKILVEAFGQDQGVRRLERNLQRLARKVIKDIVMGKTTQVVIDGSNANQYAKDALPSIEDVRHIDYTLSSERRPVDPRSMNRTLPGNKAVPGPV